MANTLGAVSRDDLRRCRIPRMPLAEQRRYGDAFRRLQELETALTTLADGQRESDRADHSRPDHRRSGAGSDRSTTTRDGETSER